MLAKTTSGGVEGIEPYPVHVEVDLSPGLQAFDLVGLPETAVRESRVRVRSALRNAHVWQVQPQLISLLTGSPFADRLDFGILCVFTCRESCVLADGGPYLEERQGMVGDPHIFVAEDFVSGVDGVPTWYLSCCYAPSL